MANKRRTYTAEYKIEAVRQVQERRMTHAEVSRDLVVHKTVIRDWVKKVEKEVRRLRRGDRCALLHESTGWLILPRPSGNHQTRQAPKPVQRGRSHHSHPAAVQPRAEPNRARVEHVQGEASRD
jgi:transposase-like protein